MALRAHPTGLASALEMMSVSQLLFGTDAPLRKSIATVQGLIDYGFSARGTAQPSTAKMRSGCCRVAGSMHERAAPGLGNLHAIVSMTTNRQVSPMKRSFWSGGFAGLCWPQLSWPQSHDACIHAKLSAAADQDHLSFCGGRRRRFVGRAVGEQLTELVGQPVVIENVAGAGGTFGTARAAKSPPDGYTLFIGTPSTHGTNVAVYPKLPYDAIKDFEPVGLITTSPLMLITSPKLEANSVRRSD